MMSEEALEAMRQTMNGSDHFEYDASIYCKDDLPTWREIYNWYKNKRFVYDPWSDDAHKLDLYWNIPFKAFEIYTCVNYFNMKSAEMYNNSKKEFEEKKYKGLFTFIAENDDSDDVKLKYDKLPLGIDSLIPPPIHTFILPNGEKNFMNTKYPRKYVEPGKIPPLKFHIVCDYESEEEGKIRFTMYPDKDYTIVEKEGKLPKQEKLLCMNFDHIMYFFFMRDIMLYFEGERVGWKDYISNHHPIKQCVTGFDPAL